MDGKEYVEPLDWKPAPNTGEPTNSDKGNQRARLTFNCRQRNLLCCIKVTPPHVLPSKPCPIGHPWLPLLQNFQYIISIGIECVKLDVDDLLSSEFDVY